MSINLLWMEKIASNNLESFMWILKKYSSIECYHMESCKWKISAAEKTIKKEYFAWQYCRHPEGSQRPLGWPLATYFLRDVCLTISCNHKVFLLSNTNKLKQQWRLFEMTNHSIKQKMCMYGDASQATSVIRCLRAICWMSQELYPTFNCFPLYIWSYFTDICNK